VRRALVPDRDTISTARAIASADGKTHHVSTAPTLIPHCYGPLRTVARTMTQWATTMVRPPHRTGAVYATNLCGTGLAVPCGRHDLAVNSINTLT